MSADTSTEDATSAAAQMKRKLDPYRGFVRKVLQRTTLTPAEARRRDGEPLEAMLDRVVAAVDETIEKARASSAVAEEKKTEKVETREAAEEVKKVKKVKKTTVGPPRLSERPVVWRREDGRLYPDSWSGNFHPDFWTQEFPARAYPLKCGLEVMLPRMREIAIIAGFNNSMPKNKIMMILKSAAQMPLDYPVQPHEIRSFSIAGTIKHLKHLKDRIPVNPPASAPASAAAPVPAPAPVQPPANEDSHLGYESGDES